jgi:hypothetical protein
MIGKNMANTRQLSLKDISQWAFETLHLNSIEEVCNSSFLNIKLKDTFKHLAKDTT